MVENTKRLVVEKLNKEEFEYFNLPTFFNEESDNPLSLQNVEKARVIEKEFLLLEKKKNHTSYNDLMNHICHMWENEFITEEQRRFYSYDVINKINIGTFTLTLQSILDNLKKELEKNSDYSVYEDYIQNKQFYDSLYLEKTQKPLESRIESKIPKITEITPVSEKTEEIPTVEQNLEIKIIPVTTGDKTYKIKEIVDKNLLEEVLKIKNNKSFVEEYHKKSNIKKLFNNRIFQITAGILASLIIGTYTFYNQFFNQEKVKKQILEQQPKFHVEVTIIDNKKIKIKNNLWNSIEKNYGKNNLEKKIEEIVNYNLKNNPSKRVRKTIELDKVYFKEGKFHHGKDGIRGDLTFKDEEYLFPTEKDTSFTISGINLEEVREYINKQNPDKKIHIKNVKVFDKYNIKIYKFENSNRIKITDNKLEDYNDIEQIVNTYLNSSSNKQALNIIKENYGIELNINKLYRLINRFGNEQNIKTKIRKRNLSKLVEELERKYV